MHKLRRIFYQQFNNLQNVRNNLIKLSLESENKNIRGYFKTNSFNYVHLYDIENDYVEFVMRFSVLTAFI